MTGYVYTDPDGDRLEIRPSHGSSVVLVAEDTADGERTCISLLIGDIEKFVTALYEAAKLPVPELAAPVTSTVTMQPGEDWQKVVDRAGNQHASVYPDPAETANAAWAGEFGG